MRTPKSDPLSELRRICLGLPEAREVEAWGAPTFRVKTMFATYSDGRYGIPDRPSAWVKALPTNRELLIRRDAERYFVPPYVGPKGWIGVLLDAPEMDWDELKSLVWDAWQLSVPTSLLRRHPDPPAGW